VTRSAGSVRLGGRAVRAVAGVAVALAAGLAMGPPPLAAGSPSRIVLASTAGSLRAAVPERAAGRAFDPSRAFATARLQVALGPRPAGSRAERAAGEELRRMLPSAHFEAVAGGLRNIVGGLPGREPAVVVGAHYDTTPIAGYLGANNSAAGVGAVIEIARDLAADGRVAGRRAVRFVLFDGEEAPAGFTDFTGQGLRGSRAYVGAHAGSTAELILLDFIANRNLRIPREADSDPRLWGRLRAVAEAVGAGHAFPDAAANEIFDDHTPFRRAGIPAIDLIDFAYPCWQKSCDTLGEISQSSIGDAGRAVLALVRSER